MKRINIGMIGAGMIGDVHLLNLKKDGRADIIWIADKSAEVIKIKKDKFGIKNGTTDYKDILSDKKVDAVIIASPPFTHYTIFCEALKSGKHVLVEKPLCVNLYELRQMIKMAKKNKNLVTMDCSARHSRLQPKFAFIKKLIDEDKIGEVYHIHHNHLMSRTFIEYNRNGYWSLNKKLSGGGPFIDWGVYDLSFPLGLLNDLPVLKKFISFKKGGLKTYKDKNIKSDVEDHAGALMEFDSGLSYYYERGAGVHTEVENETRIFGTKGSLRFSYCSWEKEEIEHYYTDENGNENKRVLSVKSNGYDDHFQIIEHFIDCILNDEKPLLDIQTSGKYLEILFSLLK